MLVPGRNLEVQPEEADGTGPPSTPTCSVCSKCWPRPRQAQSWDWPDLVRFLLQSLGFQRPPTGVCAYLPPAASCHLVHRVESRSTA